MKKYIIDTGSQGFTLIEIMTSLSIFLVVMTISMGAILGVYDANRRTQSESAIMGNLNLAVESMSREMRFGKNYHCDITSGDITLPQNCSEDPGKETISFFSSDGVQIAYRKNGSSIEKSTDAGLTFQAVTAPEVVVESLGFYVLGSGKDNTLQPKVLIKIQGYSGNKDVTKSHFALETLVSQRELDK